MSSPVVLGAPASYAIREFLGMHKVLNQCDKDGDALALHCAKIEQLSIEVRAELTDAMFEIMAMKRDLSQGAFF